jgi:L-type amino acid transporter 9
VQPYLKHIFGDIFGFLAAWTWIVAVMPATLAILSIVFIESIFSAAGITDQAGKIEHKLLSVAVLLAVSGANSISTKTSTRLNNFFVGTKFVSIFGVVLAGIVVVIIGTSDPNKDVGGKDWATKPWFGFRDTLAPDGTTIHWGKLSEWEILGHYSAALYGALWAYSGWDKVSTVFRLSNEGGLMSCRRFTSRLNFRHQRASSHSPLTLLFRPSFSVSLLQMQPTISSFHGT